MTIVGARLAGRFDVRARLRELPGYVELKVLDREVDVEMAMWVLEPGLHGMVAKDTLLAEAERLRGIVHPALRRLFAIGMDGEALWATYALVEPGPQPRSGAVMPIAQVAAWVKSVAEALDAAHQHGFSHGRLVPAEVGLHGGRLVLGGVGLWHDVEPEAAALAWRSLEQFVAPEVRGGAPPTPAADAWSLASCAAALFLGAPDGGRDPERAVAERHAGLGRALAGGFAMAPERRVAVRDLALRIADAARPVSIPTPVGAVPAPRPTGPQPIVRAPTAPPIDPMTVTPDPSAFSAEQVTGAIKRAKTAVPGAHGVMQAVSMRPANARPPSEPPPPDEDDATARRAKIRPIAEATQRSFSVKPGALGYIAPPRDVADEQAARRRRSIVIAAVAGAALIAGAVVIAAVAGGDPDPSGARGTDATTAPSPGAIVDAPPPAVDAAPARACTPDMPAIGAACIDAYESPGQGRLPDTGESFTEARDACRARGLRLCTPAEHRAACAGPGGAAWPYGATAERGACNLGARSAIVATGSFPRCKSASGAYDLAGNVAEWLADGTIAMGSAIDGGDGRCDAPPRTAAETARFADVGFRCCGDI